MSLGKNLSHILLDRNVKQKELAELIGHSEPFISKILNDEKMPCVKDLKLIADYLQVSLDELLENKTA